MTSSLRRWASLTLSRGSPRDHRERRSRGVFQGTASGLAGLVLAIIVSVISVPLTIGYLGSERYGAWVTIASVLTFLSITDFGLAASLTNALAKARAGYAVMIEGGFSDTAMGKMILAACFITDFGTVLALGGLFANFNGWLLAFVITMCVVLWFMPGWTTLLPACLLLFGSIVLVRRGKTIWSFLQVVGAGCLMIVALCHVCEALRLFLWMHWGLKHSVGHYLDLWSCVLGLTLFPLGYFFHALTKSRG